MHNRFTKIIFSAMAATYLLLVCMNNIFDYGANFQFVSHVTAMDDIFSKEKNGWRGFEAAWMHHLAYLLIIASELSIFAMLATGTMTMWKRRHADAGDFRHAGRFTAWGLTFGIVLWFSAFLTIGGEWFLMWQSKSWNAQTNAFLLTITLLLLLIHHNSDER
jgi:predicted small integral membrane protein